VSSVLSHWVLPYFAVASAPFETCLLERRGLRPLSKTQVTNKLAIVAKRNNLADLKGHSLRIGGTLFYLLKGVPFDVVKVIGRWAGEAFTLYLRDHALILAPFLQANQQLFNNFMRVAVPPV
jgi:hypothetical protein